MNPSFSPTLFKLANLGGVYEVGWYVYDYYCCLFIRQIHNLVLRS